MPQISYSQLGDILAVFNSDLNDQERDALAAIWGENLKKFLHDIAEKLYAHGFKTEAAMRDFSESLVAFSEGLPMRSPVKGPLIDLASKIQLGLTAGGW